MLFNSNKIQGTYFIEASLKEETIKGDKTFVSRENSTDKLARSMTQEENLTTQVTLRSQINIATFVKKIPPLIPLGYFVGNKAKGRILKQVLEENKYLWHPFWDSPFCLINEFWWVFINSSSSQKPILYQTNLMVSVAARLVHFKITGEN